MTILGQV